MNQPRLSILPEPCDECPFKGRFDLRSGRLKDIMDETVNANDGAGTYFSCHKTVGDGGPDAVFGGASVCAGWLEAVKRIRRVPQLIQIAERLGLIESR